LTAKALSKLLDSLPSRVLKKIAKLSKETGETVESIVERSISLYEKRVSTKVTGPGDKLDRLMSDPAKREVFEAISGAMAERSNAGMTAEQKKARALAGAVARQNNTTPERRAEIARQAGKKRQQLRRERDVANSKE
jgi:hypothetical protein